MTVCDNLETFPEHLRHSLLDQNVGYMYQKSQLSIYYSK